MHYHPEGTFCYGQELSVACKLFWNSTLLSQYPCKALGVSSVASSYCNVNNWGLNSAFPQGMKVST